jgi:hypothetical protein
MMEIGEGKDDVNDSLRVIDTILQESGVGGVVVDFNEHDQRQYSIVRPLLRRKPSLQLSKTILQRTRKLIAPVTSSWC